MAIRGVSITVSYTAWDTVANAPKTGDVANHTLRVIKDGTASAPTNSATEVDATNCPGEYKLTYTTTEMSCDTIKLCGKSSTAGIVIVPVLITTEHGVLPTVQQGSAGAVLTSGTGTGQLNVTSGIADADAKKINAVSTSSVTTVGANVGTTQPLNFTGTAGSALVKVDLVDIAGTPSAGVAGYMALDWSHINAPTTAVNLSGTTISTSQAVASVSGAVGSVTGNVGGNVVGSVGSVAGGTTLSSAESPVLHTGTATGGASNGITLQNTANGNVNFYTGCLIKTISGTGAGQVRTITAYAGSGAGTPYQATVDRNWITTPDATTVYAILVADNAKLDASLAVTSTVSDPWSTALPGSYGAGTAGNILGTFLDAPVSSRSTYAGADTAGTLTLVGRLTAGRATNLDNLDAQVSTRLPTSSYTAPPSAATIATTVWQDLTSSADFTTNGSIGKLLVTNIDAAITSRSTFAGGAVASVTAAVTVGGYSSGQDPATLVLDVAASSHNSAGTIGNKISAAGASGDPWSTALPGTYASGTAGNILGNNPDTAGTLTLLGRLTSGRGALLDNLTNLDVAVSTRSVFAGGAVASVAAPVTVGGYSTGQDPATLVLDVAISGHTTTGTVGAKINAAGASGDPWATEVPGSYPLGTAGYALGTFLDATVSSRLETTTYAAGGGAPTAEQNAAAVWDALQSGHLVAGSMGASLAVAASYPDPWLALPSIYPSGSAGYALSHVILSPAGLDPVIVESGLNARQALSVNSAACAGPADGLETNTPRYKGAGTNIVRIAAQTDQFGNRTSVVITPPA